MVKAFNGGGKRALQTLGYMYSNNDKHQAEGKKGWQWEIKVKRLLESCQPVGMPVENVHT